MDTSLPLIALMPPVDPFPVALRLAAASAVTLVIFTLWPGIDLGVAWIFFTPEKGFLAVEQRWLNAFRLAVWGASVVMALSALAGLAASWRLQRPVLRLTLADWGFIVALYALGPGLLVDVLLKRLWGRARPADITDFGGTGSFTSVTDITDQCLQNCSFVSGEVSGAAALAVSTALILWRWRDRIGRQGPVIARVLIWATVVLIGVQRIAAGRHFLSDVVLSALFTMLVAVALATVLRPGSDARR